MSLTVIHVSDTHLQPFDPVEGDLLIHSGDALNRGSITELIKFKKQLEDIKHRYDQIIFVPGNHDWILDHSYHYSKEFLQDGISNLEVLHNQSMYYKNHQIYATSAQPIFCNWAFNESSEILTEIYSYIPDSTEILITHCPAYGKFDQLDNGNHVGSKELASQMSRLTKLKLHAVGHIHCARGLEKIGPTWHSNASICNERYVPVHKENIIEL